LASKKTLYQRLTNRYLLIIRNEENFAEKKTIRFNITRLILLATVAFLIVLGLSVYTVTVVLEQWLDPRYVMSQSNRQLVDLSMRIDSLERAIVIKDQYMGNIRRVIGGDIEGLQTIGDEMNSAKIAISSDFKESIPPIDSQFRATYEQKDLDILTYSTNGRISEIREIYLFTPIEGLITDAFNPSVDHFGIDIVSKENEPVKCAADGVVVFSSWTLDSGYVIGIQHRGNLISVYKHNSELFKNVGNFVSGGEIIAIIGNTGELTSGPHLHFELWQNGNPVNPEEFVAF